MSDVRQQKWNIRARRGFVFFTHNGNRKAKDKKYCQRKSTTSRSAGSGTNLPAGRQGSSRSELNQLTFSLAHETKFRARSKREYHQR